MMQQSFFGLVVNWVGDHAGFVIGMGVLVVAVVFGIIFKIGRK